MGVAENYVKELDYVRQWRLVARAGNDGTLIRVVGNTVSGGIVQEIVGPI